jgi:protein-tyrosine-phosphatase/tRNA A37 threonylcarbamoyladenosine synthetase subunit TsaC/SUA5/YrdC
MTKILDWRKTEDPRDVIHTAVQALAEGHLVAFPNDGHYMVAASGLRPQSIEKMSRLPGPDRQPREPRAFLMMRSVGELLDYSPSASEVAIRIAQRCWPGPVDLVFQDRDPGSLIGALPQSTRDLVLAEDGWFGVSNPRHEAFLQVARLTAGPLVLMPAWRSSNSTVSPVSKVAQQLRFDNSILANEPSQVSEDIAFVIDSGTIDRVGMTTVVRVEGNRCEILREGLMTAENLSSSTSFTILIVCTGNTCRSPMAESLLKDKLKSHVESMTFRVVSAGVAAQPGGPASEGALVAMRERGLSLDEHQSRSISQSLLERSDLILTMTSNHRQAILSRWPHVSSKVFCLAPAGSDVSDPYGGPIEAYRKCADRIDQCLDEWVEKLDTKSFPTWIKNV